MDYEKKYKEALDAVKKLQKANPSADGIHNWVNDNFPELCESEDERIRKEFCKDIWTFIPNEKAHKYIAWLEKQGEQDNNEDSNILQRFSFYSYKDEPNILYLSGLYVNEECRNKGIGTKILEVADEVAKSLNCHAIRLKTKKDSNAERLYRIHGYNGLTIEASDEIWLEKQGGQKLADKVSLNFKKGDILYEQKTMSILLVYERNGNWLMTFCDYWILKEKLHMEFPYEKYGFVQEMSLVPATKEQCDLLFQKMKEAGYEWNAEKKELKMIEQTPTWSEDDEQYLLVCKNALAEYQVSNKWDARVISHWLENKLEVSRNRWRPSDEHIDRLIWVINRLPNTKRAKEAKAVIEDLIEQLKKLKGI